MHACILSQFTGVQLFVTTWTVACQPPLSMGFSQKEYWSGFSCPSPRGSSWPRDWNWVSCIADRFFTAEPPGKTLLNSNILDYGCLYSHKTSWYSMELVLLKIYFRHYWWEIAHIYICIFSKRSSTCHHLKNGSVAWTVRSSVQAEGCREEKAQLPSLRRRHKVIGEPELSQN